MIDLIARLVVIVVSSCSTSPGGLESAENQRLDIVRPSVSGDAENRLLEIERDRLVALVEAHGKQLSGDFGQGSESIFLMAICKSISYDIDYLDYLVPSELDGGLRENLGSGTPKAVVDIGVYLISNMELPRVENVIPVYSGVMQSPRHVPGGKVDWDANEEEVGSYIARSRENIDNVEKSNRSVVIKAAIHKYIKSIELYSDAHIESDEKRLANRRRLNEIRSKLDESSLPLHDLFGIE